ncbi:helix-turn-helix domain-containing protein [Thalassotalea fusca]
MDVTLKINLDLLLVKRQITLTELSEKVDITIANLSKLKCGRAKAIRFSTLIKICQVLQCTPGDLISLENTQQSR